jgi:hypothetical protein
VAIFNTLKTGGIMDTPGIEIIREKTRQIIVFLAMGSFVSIIVAIILIGWMYLRLPIDDIQKILTITGSVLTGIVGAIVGFYFRGNE